MAIRIEAPEVERRVREAARESGVPVDEYILQLLTTHLPAQVPSGQDKKSAIPSEEALREYALAAGELRESFEEMAEEELEQRVDEAVRAVRERRHLNTSGVA